MKHHPKNTTGNFFFVGHWFFSHLHQWYMRMFHHFIISKINPYKFLLAPQLRIHVLAASHLGVYRSTNNSKCPLHAHISSCKEKKEECMQWNCVLHTVYGFTTSKPDATGRALCCQSTALCSICILVSYYKMVSHPHEYFYNSVYISSYNVGSLT